MQDHNHHPDIKAPSSPDEGYWDKLLATVEARILIEDHGGDLTLGCLKVRSRAHFSCLGFGPR